MSVMFTPATMVWAAGGSGNKLFHALTGWFRAEDVDKVRLTLEMANHQGDLKVEVALRFCWAPTDNEIYEAEPPDYAEPRTIGPYADEDGVVVDTTAYPLPSEDRAALVQFGVLASNDDEPYDDLSVGEVQLRIEFLER